MAGVHPGLLLIAGGWAGVRAEGLQVHPHLLRAEHGHLLQDGDEVLDTERLDRLLDASLEEDLVQDRQILKDSLLN